MSDPQPIFNKDRATLLARLRLVGAESESAVASIDAAFAVVGTGFYDRLGAEAVALIAGYPYSEDLTAGETQRKRLKAAVTEEKWMRLELMRRMPSLFFDGSGNSGNRWNDEQLGREGSASKEELQRLENEILELLGQLIDESDTSVVSAVVFSPDTTPVYRPGGSVWPYGVRDSVG